MTKNKEAEDQLYLDSLTNVEISKKLGVSRQTLNNWDNKGLNLRQILASKNISIEEFKKMPKSSPTSMDDIYGCHTCPYNPYNDSEKKEKIIFQSKEVKNQLESMASKLKDLNHKVSNLILKYQSGQSSDIDWIFLNDVYEITKEYK